MCSMMKIVGTRLAILLGCLALPLAISRAVIGDCPKTAPHFQACPDPSTVTLCENFLVEQSCNAGKQQDKEDGPFGCRSTNDFTECLDGTSHDLGPCYYEMPCTWRDTWIPRCQPIVQLVVLHYKVQKLAFVCPVPAEQEQD